MKKRPLVLLLFLLISGILFCRLLGIPIGAARPFSEVINSLVEDETLLRVTGTVSSFTEYPEYSTIVLKNTSFTHNSTTYPLGTIRITSYSPTHNPAGSVLLAKGKLEAPAPPDNPGQFDAELYAKVTKTLCRMKDPSIECLYESSKIDVPGELLVRFRASCMKCLTLVFDDDAAQVFAAMLLGDKSALDDEIRAEWQSGGLSHMLAISGMHLSILGMGLYKLLRKLHLPLKAAASLSTLVMLLYTVFTGMSVSTVRAFIMYAVSMGAVLLGRTYDLPTALSISGILILLDNPWYLFYSGFQMSFAAAVFCSIFSGRSKLTQGFLLYFWMLPLVVSSYYIIPLLSIPLNLLLVPLMPAVLLTGLLGLTAGFLALSAGIQSSLLLSIAAAPGNLLVKLFRLILRFAGRIPCSSVIAGKPGIIKLVLYLAPLGIATWLLFKWRSLKRRVFIFMASPLLIAVLIFNPRIQLVATFLSVGQGDSICLMMPSGETMLVDGGSTTVYNVGRDRILPYLYHEGVRRLDYITATHMDSDHISGIEEILEAKAAGTTPLEIGTLILPYRRSPDETYRRLTNLARQAGVRVLAVSSGDEFIFGDTKIRVLGPDPGNENTAEDENAQCVVCHLNYRKFDLLLTGDVTGDGETHVINELRHSPITCECLKVAHHGSMYSTPNELLDLIKPDVSIISSGKGNFYGHPHAELLERLKQCGTRIYSTQESGAVTLTTDGYGYTVKTMR